MEKQLVSDVMYRLTLAINQIDGAYYYYSRRVGEKANATALLYALGDGQPHSQKEISRDWLIPMTTINTIVHDYQHRGFIKLTVQPKTREKIICLTQAGEAYAARLLQGIYEAESIAVQETLRRYTPEFADALVYFAKTLCSNLENAGHKEENV